MTRRYGRRPPYDPSVRPRLALGAFLHAEQLPPIPSAVDYLASVNDWPMYLNDEIGDCTCAAAGHMIEAWTAYGQGRLMKVSDGDVLAAYKAVSGYEPGHPDTDQGAVMQDVLDYWRKAGIGGHKIAAFAELDVRKPAEIQAALYLFGHVYIGLNVPASAEAQFAHGKPWETVADDGGILGGHAVNVGAWDSATAVRLVTWGQVQKMTWDFWDRYVEEAWVVISHEWINAAGSSPEGLAVAALGAAFTDLTGEPSPFPPTPGPVSEADRELVYALDPWAGERHVGDNHRAVLAYRAWKIRKGY